MEVLINIAIILNKLNTFRRNIILKQRENVFQKATYI